MFVGTRIQMNFSCHENSVIMINCWFSKLVYFEVIPFYNEVMVETVYSTQKDHGGVDIVVFT